MLPQRQKHVWHKTSKQRYDRLWTRRIIYNIPTDLVSYTLGLVVTIGHQDWRVKCVSRVHHLKRDKLQAVAV